MSRVECECRLRLEIGQIVRVLTAPRTNWLQVSSPRFETTRCAGSSAAASMRPRRTRGAMVLSPTIFISPLLQVEHPPRRSPFGDGRNKASARGGSVATRQGEQANGPEGVSRSRRYQRPFHRSAVRLRDYGSGSVFTVTDPLPVCPLERISDRACGIDRKPVFPIVAVLRDYLACNFPEASLAIWIGWGAARSLAHGEVSIFGARESLLRLTMSATVFLLIPRSRAIQR